MKVIFLTLLLGFIASASASVLDLLPSEGMNCVSMEGYTLALYPLEDGRITLDLTGANGEVIDDNTYISNSIGNALGGLITGGDGVSGFSMYGMAVDSVSGIHIEYFNNASRLKLTFESGTCDSL